MGAPVAVRLVHGMDDAGVAPVAATVAKSNVRVLHGGQPASAPTPRKFTAELLATIADHTEGGYAEIARQLKLGETTVREWKTETAAAFGRAPMMALAMASPTALLGVAAQLRSLARSKAIRRQSTVTSALTDLHQAIGHLYDGTKKPAKAALAIVNAALNLHDAIQRQSGGMQVELPWAKEMP